MARFFTPHHGPFFHKSNGTYMRWALKGSEPPADPTVFLSPSTIAFADLGIDAPASSLNILLVNKGLATLSSIVASIPTPSGNFTLTSFPASSLEYNESSLFAMEFDPTTIGLKTDTLQITSNASTSPDTFPITGTGITFPDISVAPTSVDFGMIVVTESSGIMKVVVSNAGGENLNIYSYIIDDPVFAIDNVPDILILPAGSTDVDLIFTPTSINTFNGNLTINSDDPDTPALIVPLTGIGVVAGEVPMTGLVLYIDGVAVPIS